MQKWKDRETGEMDDDEDDETLLDQDYDESEKDGDESDQGKRSVKPRVWVVLGTISTVTGRRVLRSGFPYPAYFVLLLQLTAYSVVAITVIVLKIKNCGKAKRKDGGGKLSWFETFGLGCRVMVSSTFSGAATLCGAKALHLYSNLPVLAMLPILIYVFDSVVLRLAYTVRLLKRDQPSSPFGLLWVVLVFVGVALTVYEDYRLNIQALLFALAAFGLFSISNTISKIGFQDERDIQRIKDLSLITYLWAGILPLALTGYAALRFENVVAAGYTVKSWTIYTCVINLAPGVIQHIFFSRLMNSAYPFSSGSALEESTVDAREAVRTTLQTGFWTILIGILGKEKNLINWLQVSTVTLIYVVSVGPKHIGYYPPRVLNVITRIFRRRPLPIHSEPWQFTFFLASTTIIFVALVGCNIMFWVDTVAVNRDARTWLGPSKINADTMYRPPKLRSVDIVIAHSLGDPIESISSLVSSFTAGSMRGLNPKVTLYTKDSTLINKNHTLVKGSFDGNFNIQTLRNVGGPAATFLHHILYSWEFLPVHTLFLSTSSSTTRARASLLRQRLNNYYIPPGFPIPDALPKTGFLNLGEHETCQCRNCYDSHVWEDTFHLIPSMFGATRVGNPQCDSVLLTYGNNFIASAARLRGVKRDVWEMLYDALMNEDLENAWAHNKEKLPKMRKGEAGKGRWAEGGVYWENDGVQRPYLGFTIERLWGVLLQCSEVGVAWRCPSLERGWRRGGGRGDCGCID